MRKITIIILLSMIGLSCYDAINDLLDELNATVPICVDSASTATAPDGRGWKNAYPSIDAALADSRTQDGAEIWVTTAYTTTGTISISRPVSIYGGFNKTEQRKDERNSNQKTEITSLSGSQVITVTSTKVIIDSFSFNNITNKLGINFGVGGYSAIIQNCEFKNIHNTGFNGTAIQGLTGSILIINCNFDSNSTDMYGGAIYCPSASLELNLCTFTNNHAGYNGGALYTQGPSINIKNCTFNNNDSVSNGGAIFCNSGEITINACKFDGNTVTSGGGGAVSLTSSTASTIVNSWFYANSATHSSLSRGGALFIGGTNPHTLVNLSFYSNQALGAGARNGGGIFIADPTNIYNSVLYNNTALNGSNIYSNSDYELEYCFYNDGLDGIGTPSYLGCIANSINSPFESTTSTNTTFLYPASVILDKGLSTAPGLPSTDFAGNPRVVGGGIDMGAYERQY
jgi:predicted outer membrane repeat protein